MKFHFLHQNFNVLDLEKQISTIVKQLKNWNGIQ